MCRQFLNTTFGEAVLCRVQEITSATKYPSMAQFSHEAIVDMLMQDALFISNLHQEPGIRGNVSVAYYRGGARRQRSTSKL